MQFLSDRGRISNDQLFWWCQVTGWFGLALLTYLSITLILDQTGPYVAHPFVQSAIGIVVSWPMRGIYRYIWDWGLLARVLPVGQEWRR